VAVGYMVVSRIRRQRSDRRDGGRREERGAGSGVLDQVPLESEYSKLTLTEASIISITYAN